MHCFCSNAQEPGRALVPALLQATLVSPQALRGSLGPEDSRVSAAVASLAAAGATAHAAVADAFGDRCGLRHYNCHCPLQFLTFNH